jgi:hypothetical protein
MFQRGRQSSIIHRNNLLSRTKTPRNIATAAIANSNSRLLKRTTQQDVIATICVEQSASTTAGKEVEVDVKDFTTFEHHFEIISCLFELSGKAEERKRRVFDSCSSPVAVGGMAGSGSKTQRRCFSHEST